MTTTSTPATDPVATAAALAAAREAHATATANHREALARAGRAAELHRMAADQRHAMLDRAASGEAVTEADLARASEAASDAADTRDLHRAVADGALVAVHRAEINELAAAANDHRARADQARVAAVEAAQQVDAAIAEARAKLLTFQDSLATLRDLGAKAEAFNTFALPDAVRQNPILASLHASAHPKLTPVPVVRQNLRLALLRDVGGFAGGTTETIPSLSAAMAALAPRTAPATKAA